MRDMNIGLTLKSKNAKTGPIPMSISSNKTCPSVCPLKANGCYAKYSYLGNHWQLISDGVRGMSWDLFVANVKAFVKDTLWRHNVAGDLPGIGNDIDTEALDELVTANKGKRGFTYTHKPPTPGNLDAIEKANNQGFTINLSGNNLDHADELSNLSVAPIVCIVPQGQSKNMVTPEGRKVVICPATTRDNVNCASCKLCAKPDRGFIIGFPAHGVGRKYANEVSLID